MFSANLGGGSTGFGFGFGNDAKNASSCDFNSSSEK